MRHRVDCFLGLRKRASISAGAAGLPRVAVSMKGRSFFPPGSNKNKSGYDIGLVHFAQELLVGSSDALLGRTPKNGGNFVSERGGVGQSSDSNARNRRSSSHCCCALSLDLRNAAHPEEGFAVPTESLEHAETARVNCCRSRSMGRFQRSLPRVPYPGRHPAHLQHRDRPQPRPAFLHPHQTRHRPPPRNQPLIWVLSLLFLLRYAFLAAE